jgi:hypothetical protein
MADSISIPAFRAEYEQRLLNGLETPKDLSVKMTKENWLTDELVAEIAGLLPEAHEKDDSGKRCPDAYLLKIGKLFPKGRMFASYTQLVQASKVFLDAWAVQKVHGQKKITCSYGINRGKKPEELHADPTKQRTQKSSLKRTDSSCPFFISYTFSGILRGNVKTSSGLTYLQFYARGQTLLTMIKMEGRGSLIVPIFASCSLQACAQRSSMPCSSSKAMHDCKAALKIRTAAVRAT